MLRCAVTVRVFPAPAAVASDRCAGTHSSVMLAVRRRSVQLTTSWRQLHMVGQPPETAAGRITSSTPSSSSGGTATVRRRPEAAISPRRILPRSHRSRETHLTHTVTSEPTPLRAASAPAGRGSTLRFRPYRAMLVDGGARHRRLRQAFRRCTTLSAELVLSSLIIINVIKGINESQHTTDVV